MPGHENSASTVIAPPSTKPRLSAICVTIGRRALGTMCRRRTASGRRPIARAVSTWSASITSATAAREMKTYCPISPSASVSVGRIMCVATSWMWSKPEPAPPGVALSPPGSHARLPAKTPMKIIPSQKSGIE